MKTLGIYLVTDTEQCGSRGVVQTVSQAVDVGVRIVQIRNKKAGAADFLAQVNAVAEAVGDRATVLVNDRVDVYLAARNQGSRVHGVHVGQSDLPAADVRRLIGNSAVLGLTANKEAHFDAAAKLPSGTIDYFGVGAIHATATKQDHPHVLGVDGFARLIHDAGLPCVAIGGIGPHDVAALRAVGAAGVAVVSAICAADNPGRATRELTAEWAGVQK